MQTPELSRREYMAGVAAAAAATPRWDGEEYDIDEIDDWDPIDGGTYETGRFTPEKITSSGQGEYAGWMLDDEHFGERTMEVFYDHKAVHLTIEGAGEGDVRGGALAGLTPVQARELGVALFQAGEELERRGEVDR